MVDHQKPSKTVVDHDHGHYFAWVARIIRIIILIIIIRVGTPLVSHCFNFTGNQNVLLPKFNIFWIPAKVEGITDERGTSADYYY